jgi:hypothetical protein
LEYKLVGANLINDSRVSDLPYYIANMRDHFNDVVAKNAIKVNSYYGWNTEQNHRRFNNMNAYELDRIRTIRNNLPEKYLMRNEKDLLRVFAETEDDLKAIAEQIHLYDIISITGPQPGSEQALLDGSIMMGKKTNYKYKVMLRDGDYDLETKELVWRQLRANKDVMVPLHLDNLLKKKYSYLWSSYFYTNDDSIVTVLALVAPGIIGKIHPIEHLQ